MRRASSDRPHSRRPVAGAGAAAISPSGVLLLAAIALEAIAVIMLARGVRGLGWLGVIGAHLAASGLSAEGLWFRRRALTVIPAQIGIYQAGGLIGLVLPIFGPCAALWLA